MGARQAARESGRITGGAIVIGKGSHQLVDEFVVLSPLAKINGSGSVPPAPDVMQLMPIPRP
jgi:hypothetical protein